MTNQAEFETGVSQTESRRFLREQELNRRKFPTETVKVPTRFRLLSLIGTGGMGRVYRAYDRDAGREVALKCLVNLTREEEYRLKGEFRSLVDVVHSNLLELYELFINDEGSFFTMELIDGRDPLSHFEQWRDSSGTLSADGVGEVIDMAKQLADAVAAIHDSGRLHRDIKPRNSLVTDSGRLVLLDFGLVIAQTDNTPSPAGTAGYMAPEVALGGRASTASDWYAYGVTLYEVIVGKPPFSSVASQVKGDGVPRKYQAIETLAPQVPAALAELIGALLSVEPNKRPISKDVLLRLGSLRSGAVPTSQLPSLRDPLGERFVNRRAELNSLRRAFDQALAESQPKVVLVRGPSGIGKSEVVEQFLRELRQETDALILRGRCHPLEWVTYNALDGIVDDLAAFFRDNVDSSQRPTVGFDSEPLLRLFPVLSGLIAVDSRPRSRLERSEDNAQVRVAAASALRNLLRELGTRHELLLTIDDAQWGDADSGRLLRELVGGPDAPALTVVITFRHEDRPQSRFLDALEAPTPLPENRLQELSLEPLTQQHARDLVRGWARLHPSVDTKDCDAAADKAGGIPFLLREFGHHFSTGRRLSEANSLGELLEAKLSLLPDSARDLLRAYAVAGGELQHRVALEAAEQPQARPILLRMLKLGLIRAMSMLEGTGEIYHGRLRELVLESLSEAEVQKQHQLIAEAMLRSPRPQLSVVVQHLVAAGNTEDALNYVLPAANAANGATAFDNAAALYQTAIDLGCTELSAAALHARLAEALMNGGRSYEAAQAFQTAAELAGKEAKTDSAELAKLRRSAAEQFIQSGHNDAAAELLQRVLAALDVRLPKTRAHAVRRGAFLRMRQVFSSLPHAIEGDVKPGPLSRVDALWSVTIRLALLDHARMGYFSAICAAEARRSNDPSALTRAYSLEAPFLALVPNRRFQRRADEMMNVAEAHSEVANSVEDRAWAQFGAGAVSWLRGDWVGAVRHLDQQTQSLGQLSHRHVFEQALCDSWRLSALAQLGQISLLRRRVREVLEESDRLKDRYLGRCARLGQPTLAWLADDRPDYSLQLANEANTWSPKDYSTPHFHYYVGAAQARIYSGDGVAAWQLTLEHWPQLKSNFFLILNGVRDELWQVRGRCALAAATQLHESSDSAAPGYGFKRLLREAARAASVLERSQTDCSKGWAALLRAGVHALKQNRDQSIADLQQAIGLFDAQQMRGYSSSARFALSYLSDSHRPLRAEAQQVFERERVVSPSNWSRLHAPGCFGHLDAPCGSSAAR